MSHHQHHGDQHVAYSTLLSNVSIGQEENSQSEPNSTSWTSRIRDDYFEPTDEEVKYETKISEHQKQKEHYDSFFKDETIASTNKSEPTENPPQSNVVGSNYSSTLSYSKNSLLHEETEDSLLLAETNHDRKEVSDDESLSDILSSTSTNNTAHSSLESSIELVEGSLIREQSVHFVNNNSSQVVEDSVLVSNVDLELERIKAKQEHLHELLQESQLSSLLEAESLQEEGEEEGSSDVSEEVVVPPEQKQILEISASASNTEKEISGSSFLSVLNPLSPKFNFWLTSTAIYSLGTIVILFSTVLYPSSGNAK